MFQFGVLSFVWGAKPTRGDGTERTVDKSWTSCRSYFFPTSIYEWVQLMLLLYC